MADTATFTTTLLLVDGRNTGIEVPPDVVEGFGAGKRVPVTVTVGTFSYPSTIATMGGKFLIPFSADKRAATGLRGGEEIEVTLVVDRSARTVEVPEDLAAALDSAGVRAEFDALAYSHRKEHVRSVVEAKKPETRARRVAAVVAKLAD